MVASPEQTASLDQLVKGAPAPNTTLPQVAASALADPPASLSHVSLKRSLQSPPDPTLLLPSAPPQIYLNLLILEASLRSQYLTLRARRRQNMFVLTLLGGWLAYFTYLLWLRPREDGKGIGGSQYWLIDMTQKLCFITGLVTALLFWATGQWERGVRWPRRWASVASRGLRGTNTKIVVIKGPWWGELGSWLLFMRPFSGGLWGGETGGSSYHKINVSPDRKDYEEEDIAPGGDCIMVLLLPKPFSPDFREGWETYRHEYWEKENERRAELRKRVRARQREVARAEGGWLWWTGWRGWKRARGFKSASTSDLERTQHHHHGQHSHAHSLSAVRKDRNRRASILKEKDRDGDRDGHSRNSSRSTTPTPELDESLRSGRDRDRERERRWSSSTAGSATSPRDPRLRSSKKSSMSSLSGAAAPGTAQSARQAPVRLAAASRSRPGTPSEGSLPWQSKGASSLRDSDVVDDGGFENEKIGALASKGVKVKPQAKMRGGEGGRRDERERGREEFVFPRAPSA